ncbi:MAG: DinB family protein [Acidobacteria bacterium]|nr:DinB family protein [Acidobacteriota bacterium]
MNTTDFNALYQHMEWADATVWKAVLASANAQSDTKLRDYLYHLHMVQRAFLRIWRNEPRDTPFPTFEDAPSLMSWARAYYTEAFAHLATLNDEQLAQPMIMPWAAMVEQRLGRPPEATTIGDTALQVTLHTLYHRGQVNARLREIGSEPPLVDYIAWVWMGKPSPDWPALTS